MLYAFIAHMAITASYGGIYAVLKCTGVLIFAQDIQVR
jgi:hypothetical protein